MKPLTILYEDQHVLAVAKDPDELVVPSQWTPKDQTLIGRLQKKYPDRVWA
ncbi:MAG: RNA pseudouridine synthase, partial [Candidatus Omnitrophica bacterium]|nr:RNA pseudouridine synthase [Candidatus Omnitrophota bacterium]